MSLLLVRKIARLENYNLSISGKIYVVNKLDKSITIFDLEKGEHNDEFFLKTQPREITKLSDEENLVFTNYGNNSVPGKSISVFNTKSKTITNQLIIKKGRRPHGIATIPNSSKVIVATNSGNTISIFDIKGDSLVSDLEVNQKTSHMVALHPKLELAYVTHVNSGSVVVFNYTQNRQLATIRCGEGTDGIDITPDGKEVWVTNFRDNTISIIDTKTNKVIKTISCESESYRLKFTNDGNYCYVTSAGSGKITVYNTITKNKIKTIILPGRKNMWDKFLYHTPRPVGITMHPKEDYAFVANSNAHKVLIIDTKSIEIVGNISTGKVPDSMVVIE